MEHEKMAAERVTMAFEQVTNQRQNKLVQSIKDFRE
jgi:hypothetical protein